MFNISIKDTFGQHNSGQTITSRSSGVLQERHTCSEACSVRSLGHCQESGRFFCAATMPMKSSTMGLCLTVDGSFGWRRSVALNVAIKRCSHTPRGHDSLLLQQNVKSDRGFVTRSRTKYCKDCGPQHGAESREVLFMLIGCFGYRPCDAQPTCNSRVLRVYFQCFDCETDSKQPTSTVNRIRILDGRDI